MQTYDRRHTVVLSLDDTMDVRCRRRGRAIVDFVVNLRCDLAGEWRQILRYDTSHGRRLHVHREWRPVRHRIEWLEATRSEDDSLAFSLAQEDVRLRWRLYREAMRRTLR